MSVSDFEAVITIARQRFVFSSADGQDLGAYKGEFVRQRCIRVTRSDTPLTVYFRPDIDLDRLEVVVELGRCWLEGSDLRPAHITEAYICEIRHGDRQVAAVTVPYHWWWSRWRWQSAPRPVVRSPAQLRQKRLIPPYGRSGLYGASPTMQGIAAAGPMSTGGLMTAMGTAGDRGDIGPFTEYQADFLINGTPAALASLLAQAEACATMPIHWRDERTGAIIDVRQYPSVGADEMGQPQLPQAAIPRNPPGVPKAGQADARYFVVEQSHTPAAAYLPFVLTDDPYYLEELEALGTMAICRNSYHRNRFQRPGVVYLGETRAFAWSARSLFQLGVVAPERPPKWLKPREYWRQCVADNLAVMRLFMASPARIHRIYHAFPISFKLSGWQHSFVSVVIGSAVWMGYEEWREAYEWHIRTTTQMCNGRSGWNRQWPTPYYFSPIRNGEKLAGLTLVADDHLDAVTAESWAEAWSWFKEEYKIDDAGWDGHSLMQNQTGPAYYLYLRGSLALATHLKVREADECYAFIARELPAAMARFGARGNARWSIDPV